MKQFYCLGIFMPLTFNLYARQDTLITLPAGYIKEIKNKTDRIRSRVSHSTDKALTAQRRLEQKLYKQYQKVNPAAAEALFKSSLDSLNNWQNSLKAKLTKPLAYLPLSSLYMYSLKTTLKFLNSPDMQSLTNNKAVSDALEKVNSLDDKFAQAAMVQQFISDRKQMLNAELQTYTAMSGQLKQLNKQAYYYTLQVKEYKEVFTDKKKAEKKALEALNKVPAYQDFLKKHS